VVESQGKLGVLVPFFLARGTDTDEKDKATDPS